MTRPPILTRPLLAQPPRTSARWMARAYLQRVLEEAARVQLRVEEFAGPAAFHKVEQQQEAVHDFRVALRRLRTWLRAWRPVLRDTVSKTSERRLRRLSRLAGKARDLEVQRTWLITQRVPGFRLIAANAGWLVERLDTEYSRALRTLATGLRKGLGPAAAGLTKELQDRDAGAARKPSQPTTAAAIARLIGAHAEKLPRVLPRVRRAGQIEAAHAARIAVRRVRYLVDSLGRRSPDLRLVINYLTGLQDELGELHDAQVLAVRVRDMSRPAPPGLPALLHRRIADAFLRVRFVRDGPGPELALAATRRLMARLNRAALP